MTCFWDGILHAMRPDERRHFGPGPGDLKAFMILHNRPATNCLWQHQPMRDQEHREHVEWIRDDTVPVANGHDTSTCDPYLCLLVELLGVDISHNYNGTPVSYTFKRTGRLPVRVLRFCSNAAHFWAVSAG